MRLKQSSPIRKAVAEQSTYYENKASAIQNLDEKLAYFQYTTKCCDLPDNNGSKLIEVITIYAEEDTDDVKFYIHVSWYRMDSGRYEFTFYVT